MLADNINSIADWLKEIRDSYDIKSTTLSTYVTVFENFVLYIATKRSSLSPKQYKLLMHIPSALKLFKQGVSKDRSAHERQNIIRKAQKNKSVCNF